MSYDINFWKQERSLALSAQEIYERLNKKEPVAGLAKLPVDDILARLKAAFPDFDLTESFPLARTSEGSIEFFWSDYHFRFDIRGICGDCQKVVDIMREFGCPMYDPQEGKRYDSQNGTALGETPKFEDTTPEQKAEMERIKIEFLAKTNGTVAEEGLRRLGGALPDHPRRHRLGYRPAARKRRLTPHCNGPAGGDGPC